MMMEATFIPIPAEITMPFSGFLVATGQFNFAFLVAIGALGSLAGSTLGFWIGGHGGRNIIEKYGKYVLLSGKDLDKSDAFYKKYGQAAVFIGRFVPVVRIFLSLVAGIGKMNYKKFMAYSVIPIIIVDGLLAWAGVALGKNWQAMQPYFHKFDLVIIIIIVIFLVWYIWRHLKRK